eukprot:2850646-Pyramimonas_sp.AAC.1
MPSLRVYRPPPDHSPGVQEDLRPLAEHVDFESRLPAPAYIIYYEQWGADDGCDRVAGLTPRGGRERNLGGPDEGRPRKHICLLLEMVAAHIGGA